MELLSFEDSLIRSINRIEELLDSAQEEVGELDTLLTPSEQKLSQGDPKVFWARHHAVDAAWNTLLNLRRQIAAILDSDSQTVA